MNVFQISMAKWNHVMGMIRHRELRGDLLNAVTVNARRMTYSIFRPSFSFLKQTAREVALTSAVND